MVLPGAVFPPLLRLVLGPPVLLLGLTPVRRAVFCFGGITILGIKETEPIEIGSFRYQRFCWLALTTPSANRGESRRNVGVNHAPRDATRA